MIKERHFSPYNDFKTGLFCKLSFFLAIILLAVYLFVKITSFTIDKNSTGLLKNIYDFSQTSQSDTILAFSILLFALGVILYFFHYQFGKLAKIAEEIENNEEYEEID